MKIHHIYWNVIGKRKYFNRHMVGEGCWYKGKECTGMEEKVVKIINEMAEYLNVSQMKKLQEVLLSAFSENEPAKAEISNEEYLQLFLEAKKIEGCSERTLHYYRTTIDKLFVNITTPIQKITTEEIRRYLVEYQRMNGCSKVTVDNVRRNISGFFHGWRKKTIF